MMPPPTPDGWTIIPHSDPNVTSYEVVTFIDPRAQRAMATGVDLIGHNSREFQGFAPETLDIGSLAAQLVHGRAGARRIRMTYRFDFRPAGWQSPGYSRKPVFDYALLPMGSPE
jgi:hypothetical protein